MYFSCTISLSTAAQSSTVYALLAARQFIQTAVPRLAGGTEAVQYIFALKWSNAMVDVRNAISWSIRWVQRCSSCTATLTFHCAQELSLDAAGICSSIPAHPPALPRAIIGTGTSEVVVIGRGGFSSTEKSVSVSVVSP